MSEILRSVSCCLAIIVSLTIFIFPAHSAKEVNIFDNTDLFAGPAMKAGYKRQSIRNRRAVPVVRKDRKVSRRKLVRKRPVVLRKRRFAAKRRRYTVRSGFPRGYGKPVTRERKVVRKEKKIRTLSKVSGRSRFSSLIAKHASNNGVPVRLAHAVVRIESNYRPGVRGGAGEIGLMQIKPATARMMGFRGSTRALYNPDTNLKYGMKYLAAAYRMSGGTICGTVLKYNAGHGARRMNPISARYCRKAKRILGR
ncbi:MAG: lytic transglycosylase domain-containing protein [Methyloligellaceae bacterium]